MRWSFNDGGRIAAGFKGVTGDCGVRAVAIALELPYRQVYDDLFETQAEWLARRRKPRRGRDAEASPRSGVYSQVIDAYVRRHGWTWTPTMTIGSGTTVHLREDELPAGRLIARCSKHFTAVIDGVIHDNHDPSRGGARAVYGYWHPKER